jgi:hypothetical protein
MAPVTVPSPVIVPVLSEMPALSVKCELDPSSCTVFALIVNALVSVSVPEAPNSKVPDVPPKVIDVAESAPSSLSRSVLPLPVASLSDPLLVMLPERSSVPPDAVIVAVQAAVAVIAPVTVPTPVMPPLDESVVPFVTVSVVEEPESVRVSLPLIVNDFM